MADVAAEQAKLLQSLAALYGWLIPAAIRTLRKASRDYHGAIATFQKQWVALMPHERTDAVDLLLSAYCDSIATGALDGPKLAYREVCRRIGFFLDRHRTPRASTELADTIADRIHAIAGFCRARFPDAPSSQYTTEWEELIAGPAGLNVNKVRRMDDAMAEAVLRGLDRLLLGLRNGQAGLRKLESADTVLIIAHFDSQPTDTRFERLRHFLRDIGNLWSGHLLASAPEVVALRTAEASLATPHSRQLFTALSPPQQFYAIDNARKIVFAACEGRAQSDELPSLNEALHDFFQPLLHPQVSAAFPVSKPPPATFASLSHGRMSDRKARRYYGTTAPRPLFGLFTELDLAPREPCSLLFTFYRNSAPAAPLMDALVAEEQAALLTQLEALYTWFGPLARGVRNAKRDLGNASTIIPQEWPLMLPHEREGAVEALLGEYCSARGTGTLNGAAVMYRALFHRIGFAWEHCRSNGSAADAMVRILQRVRSLEALYRQASLGVCNVARLQAFASWEQTLLSPAGIIAVKVQRLNGPVLNALLANLDHHLRKLQEMPPDDLPMPDIFLPSADTLFIKAHLTAGSTDDRFRRLRDLFKGIVALVFAPSSTVPDIQRRSLLSARGSLAQPHSEQHFATLAPARQFLAINSARKLLFSACERMELDRMLPDVDQLLHSFFQPILSPHPVVESFATQAAQIPPEEPTHEDSLAHQQRNISDRKARRYYGTTSRAWTARRAGMGWSTGMGE